MSIRDIKIAARKALHDELAVKGYLYPVDGGLKVVSARPHTEFAALGDVKGTSLVYAERRDTQDKLIFELAEHNPKRGDVFVISDQEAYRVDNVDPPYNITVMAMAIRLTAKELRAYTAPPAVAGYSQATGYLPTARIVAV